MSISTPRPPAEPKLPDGFEPRMLSFDVYGTLVNTPPANVRAFQTILADARRLDLDPNEFYSFWEQRNIAHTTTIRTGRTRTFAASPSPRRTRGSACTAGQR